MSDASSSPLRPRIIDVGFDGMLVNFSDVLTEEANRAALAFRAGIDALKLPGLRETTTSLTSTFVLFDPLTLDRDALRTQLEVILAQSDWGSAPLPSERKLWRIPAVFEGGYAPQLQDAADLAGVSPKLAIEQICDTTLGVMTIGFAPGQPYLGSLPANWDIPRQQGLTPQVPVGAITVAIRQIVLFATPSPTGWRQVGQCGFRSFRPNQAQPFALRPGDAIRFEPVSPDTFAALQAKDTTGDGGATWEPVP